VLVDGSGAMSLLASLTRLRAGTRPRRPGAQRRPCRGDPAAPASPPRSRRTEQGRMARITDRADFQERGGPCRIRTYDQRIMSPLL
jgi:hypothetical protein